MKDQPIEIVEVFVLIIVIDLILNLKIKNTLNFVVILSASFGMIVKKRGDLSIIAFMNTFNL